MFPASVFIADWEKCLSSFAIWKDQSLFRGRGLQYDLANTEQKEKGQRRMRYSTYSANWWAREQNLPPLPCIGLTSDVPTWLNPCCSTR